MNTFSGGFKRRARLCKLASLSHLLTYELDLAVVFDMIEGDADSGSLSVENRKLAAVGFPCKCNDALWKDRDKQLISCFFFLLWETIVLSLCVLHSYPSSPPHRQEPASLSCGRFQSWWPRPEKDRKINLAFDFFFFFFLLNQCSFRCFSLSLSPLVYLCSFRSPVHLHTQVISIPLPVQFAVDNVEEVADTDLLTGRHLHQSHSGWDVFVLRYPECYDVVTGRPWEVPVDTQTLVSVYT